jgi:hypothetical protein
VMAAGADPRPSLRRLMKGCGGGPERHGRPHEAAAMGRVRSRRQEGAVTAAKKIRKP